MDTAFAKIVSDLDGRDHILVEGHVISLRCDNTQANNEFVSAIVHGLRRSGCENGPLGLVSGAAVGQLASAT